MPERLAAVLDAFDPGGPPEAYSWNFLTFFDLRCTELEESFLEMFGAELSEWTKERLLTFSRGEDGLRKRLLDGLSVRCRELKDWRNRAQTMQKRIRDLQDAPVRDEERQKELDTLREEQAALLELVQSLQ